jgi:hypothetical protein
LSPRRFIRRSRGYGGRGNRDIDGDGIHNHNDRDGSTVFATAMTATAMVTAFAAGADARPGEAKPVVNTVLTRRCAFSAKSLFTKKSKLLVGQ